VTGDLTMTAALLTLFAGVSALLITPVSSAQSYPARPIRIIVPQTPGGTADTMARILAPGLSAALGQQLVIDNRGGAGGIIGTDMVARAAPDGYTLSFNGTGPLAISPNIHKDVPYDPVKDFQPVCMTTVSPFALVTHPSVRARTVRELIALARTDPGKLNYASAGSGSVVYLGMELFKTMAGIDILHVPYKGTAPGLTDVMAGQVAMMLYTVAPALQHAAAERLRVLGISSAKRSSQRPDIPTIAEAGLAGYEVTTWTGLLAPAKTPREISARLHDAMLIALRAPQTRAQLDAQGVDIVGGTGEEFAAFIREDVLRNARVIKAASARAE
jgi:tripartite-type tricarboxylate transporter receptor subunit TctC